MSLVGDMYYLLNRTKENEDLQNCCVLFLYYNVFCGVFMISLKQLIANADTEDCTIVTCDNSPQGQDAYMVKRDWEVSARRIIGYVFLMEGIVVDSDPFEPHLHENMGDISPSVFNRICAENFRIMRRIVPS